MARKFTPRLRARLRALRRRLVARDEAPAKLRLVTWNMRVGRNRREAARELKRQVKLARYPHVVCLQEAGTYLSGIRGRLVTRGKLWGYRVYVSRRNADAHHTLTLVRRDVPVRRHRFLAGGTDNWWGPVHGWLHPPRTFVLVDLGTRWRIINVHRAWVGHQLARGGRNVPAWRAEDDRLVQAARFAGARALVIVGDQNSGVKATEPWSVPHLAARIGAHLVSARGGVDYAAVRGADGVGVAHGKAGSDHRLRRFTFRLSGTRAARRTARRTAHNL